MNCDNCGANLEVANQICEYCGSSAIGGKILILDSDPGPSSVGMTINNSYKGQERRIAGLSYLKQFWKIYKKIALVTLGAWVALYFYTCTLPDRVTNMSRHHSILISPMGETLWFVRGSLLMIVIPVLLTWLYMRDDSKYHIRKKDKVKKE